MIFDLITNWRKYLKDPVFIAAFSMLEKKDFINDNIDIVPISYLMMRT